MLTFNNTHLFTGYLKQLLATTSIPSCRIYTKEFAEYKSKYYREDPRVIRSFKQNVALGTRITPHIDYILNGEVYSYIANDLLATSTPVWTKKSNLYFNQDKHVPNFTKRLESTGPVYDTKTHEYLGNYLRYLRDYNDVNLMSLYNCFNNRVCNNLYLRFKVAEVANHSEEMTVTFDSRDTNYTIYAIPVKLFCNYTIAIDCDLGIEMCCSFYNTALNDEKKVGQLEASDNRYHDLASKTYKKVTGAIFKQPFLYDKLDVAFWGDELMSPNDTETKLTNPDIVTRYDIANQEHNLKLFLKVPKSCRSSIVILEGDFRNYNDNQYYVEPISVKDSAGRATNATTFVWKYKQNHCVVNNEKLSESGFKPVHKLQLLAFNTKESYPFADRLIEYLSGSAITPIDPVPDNIKRVQKVMYNNNHHFRVPGVWEDRMQKILYDYVVVGGNNAKNGGGIKPAEPVSYTLDEGTTDETELNIIGMEDARTGYHRKLGYSTKSTMYDLLGYVDKDTERIYAYWTNTKNPRTGKDELTLVDNIHSVDIYRGLYDKF